MGERGGWGVGEVGVDHDFDVVGGEDFEGGGEGGLGEGVGVLREEEGARGVLVAAVVDDGLGDGGDVVVVEGGVEGAAAMSRGSEGYALGGDVCVGVKRVEGGDEAGDVDEGVGAGELAGLVGEWNWIGLMFSESFDKEYVDYCTIWDVGSGGNLRIEERCDYTDVAEWSIEFDCVL